MSYVKHGSRLGLPLTEREWEVLRVQATGQRRKEVAATLGISSHTLRNLLDSIFRKLDATGLVEVFAIVGWLKAEPPEARIARRLAAEQAAHTARRAAEDAAHAARIAALEAELERG